MVTTIYLDSYLNFDNSVFDVSIHQACYISYKDLMWFTGRFLQVLCKLLAIYAFIYVLVHFPFLFFNYFNK